MIKLTLGKRAVLFIVLFFGVVVSIELMAWVAYWLTFHEPFSYRALQTSRLVLLRSAKGDKNIDDSTVADEREAWLNSWLIHPYYGFISNPASSPLVNKFGFLGPEDQVQPANPHTIVVALLGGSVAAQLASHAYAGDVLRSELTKISSFRDKELIILNLGNGAFKQPQGLFVVSDLLSRGAHIDVLISLDGFNEIALPEAHGNLANGVSPFYPQHWRQLVDTKLSRGQVDAQARARFISDMRIWLASVFSGPMLNYSIAANFIWRVADAQISGAVAAYQMLAVERAPIDPTSRLSNDQRAFLGPAFEYQTRRDLYVDIARNWGRSSALLNNSMTAQGGVYLHFLQPNQYVAGSKRLTEHEMRTAIHPNSPYRRAVEIGYPYLQAMGEGLRSHGLWFRDLTAVFADVSADLYSDSCCHVNKEGNAILAHAIAEELIARLSNHGTGTTTRLLDLRQINFNDSLFSADELRRFVPNSSDYNDGSLDKITNANN
jgi:hypothetical protein